MIKEVSMMNEPSPDLIKDADVHHQLNDRHLFYRKLFHRLDKNHDGRIEVDQLIELVEQAGVETAVKKQWAIASVSFLLNKRFSRIFLLFFIAYY